MARGDNLKDLNRDPEHQRMAALARTQDPAFLQHNREIAPDGPAAQFAYFRARKGSALIDHWHAEFLFLDDYAKSINSAEHYTEEERRWLHGWHVWHAIWDGLNAPTPPEDANEFAERTAQAQAAVGQGLALRDVFDIIYLVPDDWCDREGLPLSRKNQRKIYRSGMEHARAAAVTWSNEIARQRAKQQAHPRNVGQRAPAQTTPPAFPKPARPAGKYKHHRRVMF